MSEATYRTPHACPVCNGHGTVSRPPWVAGDQLTWPVGGTGSYPCRACAGSGIVWEQPEPLGGVPVTVRVRVTTAIVANPHAGCDPRAPCSTGCTAGRPST